MTDRFYLGLTVAILILVLAVVVAPQLRLRQREKKRRYLEDWYASGPKPESGYVSPDAFTCSLCSSNNLRKALFGAYERKDLLNRLNPLHVDEAKFYEYRCAKCGSVAYKEKVLIAPAEQS